jgi:Signal transduction histidine kinase
MRSIKLRITLSIVICLIAANFAAGYYIVVDTKEELTELFNAEQAQLARIIDSIIARGISSPEDIASIADVANINEDRYSNSGHHYEKKLAFQVWDKEGNLWMMSRNAPLYPLSAQTPGFSKIQYGDAVWHIFSLYSSASSSWIYTAQRAEVRDELIGLIILDLLIPLLFITLIVIAVVTICVHLGTLPIKRFTAALQERDDTNLASLDTQLPAELEPIRHAVNNLLRQVNEALNRERSFNADAAHELRTPLAALRVHAQNLQLGQQVSGETANAVNKIILSIDKMVHTVEQLLLLNRLDAHRLYDLADSVNLASLTRETIAELPAAALSDYDFELQTPTSTTTSRDEASEEEWNEAVLSIRGNHNLLRNLVRNLIENAYKYSAHNTAIKIAIEISDKYLTLTVIDQGPGMTDEQKANATDRFYRVSDRQQYGTGLGLSIVMRIVTLHKAELSFNDNPDGHGLACSVKFLR